MSRSLLEILADEVDALLEPVVGAAEGAWRREQLLASVGAVAELRSQTSLSDPELAAALEAVRTLRLAMGALRAGPESTANVQAMLASARQAFDALRALRAPSGAAYADLGLDLLRAITAHYLRAHHATSYSLGVLLGLIQDGAASPPVASVFEGMKLVRDGYEVDRFRFDRLGPLLQNPLTILREEYGAGWPTSVHQADALADKLFPRLGVLLSQFGLPWQYGIREDERSRVGAPSLAERALIVYLPHELAGDDGEAGLVLSLSPRDHGDLGVVVMPFGALGFTHQRGRLRVQGALGAGVQTFAVGRHGLTLVAAPGTHEVDGQVVATLEPDGDEPALVFGSRTGTRIEVGKATASARIALSEARQVIELGANLSKAVLVIVPGEGDSFLRQIGPSDGWRTELDLGLLWSNVAGLRLQGAASLDTTLPVELSIGRALKLRTVHLALRGEPSAVRAEVSATAELSIGPVRAVVERVGLRTELTFPERGGNLGLADLAFDFKPPQGLGLSIDAPVVQGGGFLSYDGAARRYAGALHLSIENKVDLSAWGLVQGGGAGQHWSLAVFLAGRFPPIELGWGFRLTAVGGMLALHRRMDPEALRDAAHGVRGNLDALLFPERPETRLPELVAAVDRFFPAQEGSHVFGPMVEIDWGRGSQKNARFRAALLFQLDAGRAALYGLAQLGFPRLEDDSILRLRAGIEASYDGREQTACFSMRILEGKLFRTLELAGGAGFLVRWGKTKEFAFTLGGFHPRFLSHAPKELRGTPRLSAHWKPIRYVTLDIEQYCAITSTSFQFGFSADAQIGVSWGHLKGHLSYDLLLMTEPRLHFEADINARVKVKLFGIGLFSTSLKGALEGPSPWVISGKIKVKILFGSVSKSFRYDWGERRSLAAPPASAKEVLSLELGNSGNWSTVRTRKLPVKLRRGTGRELAPRDLIEVRQSRLPFGTPLEVLDGHPLADPGEWTLAADSTSQVEQLADLHELYPERRFLRHPSKERPFRAGLKSGARFGNDSWEVPAAIGVDLVAYEEEVVDAQLAASLPKLAKSRTLTRAKVILEKVR
jgi:hypothetical protein